MQVEKELAGIQGRLNNPKFVANAKPEYIKEVQEQAADAADRLAVIGDKLQQVQKLKQ
jgi:valyl-tRNA synthetase